MGFDRGRNKESTPSFGVGFDRGRNVPRKFHRNTHEYIHRLFAPSGLSRRPGRLPGAWICALTPDPVPKAAVLQIGSADGCGIPKGGRYKESG